MKEDIAASPSPGDKGQANGQDVPSVEHSEEPKEKFNQPKESDGLYDAEGRPTDKIAAIFENPLAGIPREKLFEDVGNFCRRYGLEEHLKIFQKRALISQSPATALDLPELTEDEEEVIRREKTHKWSQPWQLYFMAGRS